MAENKGNPYHDEEGKFTSGGNNKGRRLDDAAHNPFKKKGQGPFADPNNEMENAWVDLFGLGQKIIDEHKKAETPIKKKFNIGTLDGDVLGEPIEAASEEEAYKMAEQMYPGYGDELSVDEFEDTEDKLGRMGFVGDEENFGDIDDDYERSYGPVDTKEKYDAYLKWKEDN